MRVNAENCDRRQSRRNIQSICTGALQQGRSVNNNWVAGEINAICVDGVKL